MKEFNSPEEMEFGTSQGEMNINRAQFIATTANTDMIASGVIYPDTATDNIVFRITPPTTSLNYQFQAIYTIA